jgi:hypothetical protein
MASGRFARVIRNAISKLPFARRRLDFLDTDPWVFMKDPFTGFPRIDIVDALYQILLDPSGYQAATLCSVIPEALGAIGSAGTCLETVHIQLEFPPGGTEQLVVPRPETRGDISYATQQLRRFAFVCTDSMTRGDTDNISELVQACLKYNSPSLWRLVLDMGKADDMTAGSIGQALISPSWPQLTVISLIQVSLELSDLLHFLRALPASPLDLTLADVRLLSGTWKEVLDTLREKSYRDLDISDPIGAGCGDVTDEVIADIVGEKGDASRVS